MKSTSRHTGEVLIAGGGIAGLTCALFLNRAGIPTRVFERHRVGESSGLGIQLSPNATRLLACLGLADALQLVASKPDYLVFRNWKKGNEITRVALGQSMWRKYGAPYYQSKRQDLIQILLERATETRGITIHESTTVREAGTINDLAYVDTASERFQGALVIGADGTHSTIRENLFGSGFTTYAGCVAWRALVDRTKLQSEQRSAFEASLWMGPNKHVVHYPVGNNEQINIVAVVDMEEYPSPSWHAKGRKSEALAQFAGWHQDLLSLLNRVEDEEIFWWALYRKLALPPWHKKRVVLVGDACHTTLPFMAQGASLAIEDSAMLARCLANELDLDSALATFVAKRKRRAKLIAWYSRQLKHVYHASWPQATVRDWFVPLGVNRLMGWVYSYDALTD